MHKHTYYLADMNGKLRFTDEGLRELRPYFAMAGIDIHTITTETEYLKARHRASPYFLEWLKRRSENWPENDQFELLKSTLFG
ncbi:MAG: hypothetical protein CSH49_16655 [Alcanivorax sp.]|jgi:hypothetical protein|nr:MAG: hypothetical protein CSH49_16655 [Alcanivorax sp.]